MTETGRPKIVIIGGGFAGAYSAKYLEAALKEEQAEILLIDRHNYFIFYPLLAEAGTGNLEPRHAVVPIRKFLKRGGIFRMAEVTDIDFQHQLVSYKLQGSQRAEKVNYDQLIIAPGSVTNLPDIPGLNDFSFELKSLSDAVALRDRAIHMLELADATSDPEKRRSLLHFVVVGGNFTGVETAGEFDVFLKDASRLYKNVRSSDCKVTLIEITERILPALEEELSNYAVEQMRRRGMEIRLNNSVERIGSDYVILKSGETVPTQTVVWCAGIAPSKLIGKLSLPVDQRGYVLCDRELRVKGFENVWAIGDSAVNIDPSGNPYPATAQHAVGEARFAAKNIERAINGKEPLPCNLSSKGTLAALGCRTAVAKVFGFKLSGFPAWFLWRTVYLFKMPGWARKLRVALDWTMGLLFNRDFVELGVHRKS